jgi:hypothetical protein
MAVLDGGVPASAERTAVVPGGARLLPTMSRAGRVADPDDGARAGVGAAC